MRNLKAFVEREGHANVGKSYKTEDGYALGSWVNKLRQRRESLSPDQIARLESCPDWTWDARDAKWEKGFNYLKAFVGREGHARPSAVFKTEDGYPFGAWVYTKRHYKARIPPEHIARLESLPGWLWDVRSAQWEEGFNHLEAFAEREGHARPSKSCKTADGFALGVWVGWFAAREEKTSVT